MRKLAPMFIMTSLIALAGGNALAGMNDATTTTTTDKMGAPTVSSNTKDSQRLSYSDKSNTSPGTNAKMGDKSVAMWNGVSTDCATIVAMDDAKLDSKMKREHARAKMDCSSSMSSMPSDSSMHAAPASGTGAAKVNSTTGTSGK